MIRGHKTMVAAQERQSKGSTAAKISSTAETAGDVAAGAELATAGLAAASNAAEDVAAAKAVARFTGPIGHLLNAASQTAGFKADRASGMPLDEALIKHGGGLALSTMGNIGGSVLGGVAGVPGGPGGIRFGATTVGYMGGKDGEYLATDLARGWRGLKKAYGKAQYDFNRTLAALNDPKSWVQSRDGY